MSTVDFRKAAQNSDANISSRTMGSIVYFTGIDVLIAVRFFQLWTSNAQLKPVDCKKVQHTKDTLLLSTNVKASLRCISSVAYNADVVVDFISPVILTLACLLVGIYAAISTTAFFSLETDNLH